MVIHPQSIIHSAVCFQDGSVIAQMGPADMKIPIQHALNYPNRPKNDFERLDIFNLNLTTERPDRETFKPIQLAYDALEIGGTMPAVMNGANERAVEKFLDKKIKYLAIADSVEEVMRRHKPMVVSIPSVMAADEWSRNEVEKVLSEWDAKR